MLYGVRILGESLGSQVGGVLDDFVVGADVSFDRNG
jgi:hypothetical protein